MMDEIKHKIAEKGIDVPLTLAMEVTHLHQNYDRLRNIAILLSYMKSNSMSTDPYKQRIKR
jgi:hypothetical protein